MQIKSLVLNNFRNHKNLALKFQPGINFLCGGNAHGKTNIVESIYYFATTKSFRTSKDNIAITDGESCLTSSLEVERSYGNINL